MNNNSQGRRNDVAPKTVSADDALGVRSESREHRADLNPVDEAVSIETETVSGVVTDCLRLNVRKEPSSDGEVLTIIDTLSEVVVDVASSSDEFYKICTAAGIEGFCMKKYIALRR